MADKTAAVVDPAQHGNKELPKEHEKHCFIAMPSGRTPQQKEWFEGWYQVVIKPTIEKIGYDPQLLILGNRPIAINDEVRTHLAFDPMAVFDLGGMVPDDDPNPNVMYELGIRHAFGLPMVTMAWKGQELPFDVGNQRAIMEERGLKHLETNKTKLASSMRCAQRGDYYKPMEAVGRTATIEASASSPTTDATLKVLIQQLQEFKESVSFQLSMQQQNIQEIRAFLNPPNALAGFGRGLLGRSALLASGDAGSAVEAILGTGRQVQSFERQAVKA